MWNAGNLEQKKKRGGEVKVRITLSALSIFTFFSLFYFFCHIQTFFYTIIKLFVTLLVNVNKSRTGALSITLSIHKPSSECPLKINLELEHKTQD
jgi:hypothetical protein